MAQVRYKVDISRVLKRLAEVKKVGADGIRELTLEYAKRAASKAIRTTPPNSLKNGGNGKRTLEEHIARDIGGDPLETDVRLKRGEDGSAAGCCWGCAGRSLRAWPPFPRMPFCGAIPC